MLVQINSDTFVLASDVVSVRKIHSGIAHNVGKWHAGVKHEHGVSQYVVDNEREKSLVLEINNFLEK